MCSSPELFGPGTSTPSSKGHTATGYQPDLTDGLRRNNEYVYTSDKNSNCSGSQKGTMLQLMGGQFSEMRPLSEHFYEQPMVVFQAGGGKAVVRQGDVSERTPFIDTTAGRIVPKLGNQAQKDFHLPPPPPPHLFTPRFVDQRSLAWNTVTELGTKMTVANTKVSLTVPQGAISLSQDMYVALLNQDRYRPQLDSSQTPVTPVVQCGPTDATHSLQKPVVLSVPHVIGSGTSDKNMMRVLYCSDLDHEDAEWTIVYGNGSAESDSGIYMEVDPGTVHLVTERLGAYVLVANVTDLNHIGGCETQQPRTSSMVASSSGYSSLGSPLVDHPLNCSQLPAVLSPSTMAALSRILDASSCEGNGWQQLATAIGADHYNAHFASQPSPANALLRLWESRNRDPDPLQALARLLKQIRREDAIVILERDIKK